MAVSAEFSVDCPKQERLKLISLFSDGHATLNIGAASQWSSRPVYEDTFNTIEEFLLISLYDDWKVFMQTEASYFNQVLIHFIWSKQTSILFLIEI